MEVVLVVDVANVMGSRPDGWWRDREGAATRLLTGLGELVGTDPAGPDGAPLHLDAVVAVLEGRARTAQGPAAVDVRRAQADGDTTVVEVTEELATAGRRPLVVTADRGLRARLPQVADVAGPGWLNPLLGR